MGWCELPAVVLRHGPLVAGGAALAVTPGAVWGLGMLLERRRPRLREEYLAISLGDPLLALAVGLGVRQLHGAAPAGPAAPPCALAFAAGCLGFGLLQWRAELRAGYFSRAQALAPTKIWHQLVVYPALGGWLWSAVLGGLRAAVGGTASGAAPGLADRAGQVLPVLCVLGWAATHGYDRRHPKLGHPPYDWRRLRPHRRPWAATSTTLRAYRDARPCPAAGVRLPSEPQPQPQSDALS
ncbi:hypothetical protein OG455_09295 [Kitasatospora sp. NBC_01287]|uniref:hypothetical protein n=1 Tax=Kitasatospora sp. NBC_01287 TaxID=2903573 RepID=UPI0022566B54|nr:hypothetical protein [Kitasatospora sp. NBC_01287]MCX4745714.1 hypothetical protein [Kitasatospora sp. NBC_01287]